jgi:3-oxoacyl-[acyl-carrier-protein] synthase-3
MSLRKALVVCADTITSVLHPMDRSLVTLHGDGAAVALLAPCPAGEGLLWFELGTDGSGADKIIIPASGTRTPRSPSTKQEHTTESGIVRTDENLQMDGPAVFHFSLHQVPDAIQAALAKHQMQIEDFDLVLLHQANRTMVDLIYKALKIPVDKRFYFMEKVGNTAGASTPMLLAEAWRQGRIKPGQRTLTASFGNGLSWGIMAVKWPETMPVPSLAEVEFTPPSKVG